MGRAVHFEIHATDPARAQAFYERVFGWTFARWGEHDYWLITTGGDDKPGVNGALLPRRGPAPAEGAPVSGYVVTVETDDIDATVRAALDAGAVMAVPVEPVPGVGWRGYLRDPDGNIVGVLENDPKAGTSDAR